jgi:putative hydrolase of the HAD superfamily
MSDIDQQIRELFLQRSRLLEPLATGVAPSLKPLPGIRAVIFDIYGTLVCSGVGDISLAVEEDRDGVIHDLLVSHELMANDHDAAGLSDCFHALIKADHATKRTDGIEYPEVDILEIWRRLLDERGTVEPHDDRLKLFAAEYECSVNPVWPYPELSETLRSFQAAGVPLGIVSNAQFYTPLMLEAFLNAGLIESGFEPDLQIWSFAQGRGKPSLELFEAQAARLAKRGIRTDECVFVGNDMLKDIWAAKQLGFHTVLFAGDQRSLRLHETDSRCTELAPDRIVTQLSQLTSVLAVD